MSDTKIQKDLVISLLKGSSAPIQISDLLRGLRNRGVEIDYPRFEDWLLDQKDIARLSVDGCVELHPEFDASRIRPSSIIPDPYNQERDVDANTRLHQIIRYYIDCLRETGKSLFAYSGQQNINFITLAQEILYSGKMHISVRTSQFSDFVKNIHGGKQVAYYGYPLLLQWIQTGDGEFANYKVTPVFIGRLDLQEEPEKCIFHLASNTIRLNPLIISESKWKDRNYVLEKLDAKADNYSSINERVSIMEAVLQQWPSQETLDPKEIIRASDLAAIKPDCSGFYNRCGIFTGGSNPYIAGLIRDLGTMLDKSAGHFNGTALETLFQSATENAKSISDPARKIRVFSPSGEGEILNAPQETAVERALSQKISVVTGPPGTGKSQVVASIIASAIMQDKTVLFASRNNKALEVVQERFSKICPDAHALVRVGGNYDKTAFDMLDRLGNLPGSEIKVPFYKQIEVIGEYLRKLDTIDNTIEKVLNALAENFVAEGLFDGLKNQLARNGEDTYQAIKLFDADCLLTVAHRFEKIVQWTATLPNLVSKWILQAQKKNGAKEIVVLRDALAKAGIEFNPVWPKSKEDLKEAFSSILRLIDLVKAVDVMAASAEKLSQVANLDSLFGQVVKTKREIAKKVPSLLQAKVRENATGSLPPDETQEALLKFRDMIPQFKKEKGNSEQGRALAQSIGNIFPKVLKRLPVWAVTNLSIAGRIPLEPRIFDLLIVDESSQCDIPSCFPLLYRAKQAVIIGDPLQLPQITQIAPSDEDNFLRRHGVAGPDNNHLKYSEKSMYDAARRVTPNSGYQFLSSHYRCHPEIIQFANSTHWYENRLEVFTDVERLKRPHFWKKGIEWIQVSSRMVADSKRYFLPEEVQQTVGVVKDLLEKHRYEGTVGVVCPHRGMVNRIRDQIEKSVDARLLQASHFEAQTAHGFQGDERDVIIYAMGVHPSMPRGPKWFVAENSNLFNVALSRARATFVVVGDMEAIENIRNDNTPITYLVDFVHYVKSLGNQNRPPEGEPTFSPEQLWEERFYLKALKPANLPVVGQYPLGPYKLDFALIRKNRDRKLDIEIDGETFHKDSAGKRLRRDIDRDIYVKAQDGHSWDVMRFWVYELREDMEACLEKIRHWMNSAP